MILRVKQVLVEPLIKGTFSTKSLRIVSHSSGEDAEEMKIISRKLKIAKMHALLDVYFGRYRSFDDEQGFTCIDYQCIDRFMKIIFK